MLWDIFQNFYKFWCWDFKPNLTNWYFRLLRSRSIFHFLVLLGRILSIHCCHFHLVFVAWVFIVFFFMIFRFWSHRGMHWFHNNVFFLIIFFSDSTRINAPIFTCDTYAKGYANGPWWYFIYEHGIVSKNFPNGFRKISGAIFKRRWDR